MNRKGLRQRQAKPLKYWNISGKMICPLSISVMKACRKRRDFFYREPKERKFINRWFPKKVNLSF
mgnify:CR=1 FL=1